MPNNAFDLLRLHQVIQLVQRVLSTLSEEHQFLLDIWAVLLQPGCGLLKHMVPFKILHLSIPQSCPAVLPSFELKWNLRFLLLDQHSIFDQQQGSSWWELVVAV